MADRELLAAIGRALDELPPACLHDLEEWAAWHDRHTAAVEWLRDEAHLAGCLNVAEVSDRLAQRSRQRAAGLRDRMRECGCGS